MAPPAIAITIPTATTVITAIIITFPLRGEPQI